MRRIPYDIKRKLDPRNATIRPGFARSLKQQLFEENTMATQKKTSLAQRILGLRALPGLAALAAIVIVGSASAIVATNQTNRARNSEIEIPTNLDGVKSIDEIRSLALTDVPNGTIVGIELEQEDNGLVYKVKFADGSVRLYNAKTGANLTANSGVETDDSVPAGFTPSVTLVDARAIAQAQRPGQTITKIELESENGVIVYSVRFSDGGRVDVNATDGSILRVRTADSSSSSDDDSSDDSDDNSGSDDDNSDDDNSGSSNDDDSSGSGSGSDDD